MRLDLTFGNDIFELRVTDDGQGIDAAVLNRGHRAGHWGLPGMKERAERVGGTLSVKSSAGVGTDLRVIVPAAIAHGRSRKARA